MFSHRVEPVASGARVSPSPLQRWEQRFPRRARATASTRRPPRTLSSPKTPNLVGQALLLHRRGGKGTVKTGNLPDFRPWGTPGE